MAYPEGNENAALPIFSVSDRRKLLIVFTDWLKEKHEKKQLWRETTQLVDWFIKNNL